MIGEILNQIKNYISNFNYPIELLRGELIILTIIITLSVLYYLFKKKKFWKSFIIVFELLFEKIYDFFDDILWEGQKKRVKSYIIWLFFIILFSNLLWSLVDLLNTMFPKLDEYIAIPTADSNFNIWMALIAVTVILVLQFKALWFWKFIYAYLPFFWKDIITVEKWNMNNFVYYPLKIFVKIFDIIISMFVWILDIIWNIAKVISLSFRLYWNMMSWTMLLWMLVMWLNSLTTMISNIEFPIIFPLIIVLQGLLTAVIQAFVFALLTAIFVKVATE